MWLVEHTLSMFEERNYRWPGSATHHTLSFIEWCGNNVHNTIITKQARTPFAIAIGENCECRKNKEFDNFSTIEKYREYIRKDKSFATWTRTKKPFWY
jgi:hypothetical protein